MHACALHGGTHGFQALFAVHLGQWLQRRPCHRGQQGGLVTTLLPYPPCTYPPTPTLLVAATQGNGGKGSRATEGQQQDRLVRYLITFITTPFAFMVVQQAAQTQQVHGLPNCCVHVH